MGIGRVSSLFLNCYIVKSQIIGFIIEFKNVSTNLLNLVIVIKIFYYLIIWNINKLI